MRGAVRTAARRALTPPGPAVSAACFWLVVGDLLGNRAFSDDRRIMSTLPPDTPATARNIFAGSVALWYKVFVSPGH